MTAQTWRVVLESGEVKSAEVRARRWADGLWWHLASPYDGGACKTPRAAVAQLAAYAGFGSEVIEIRAPGEPTTADAVAAAVAAETARCVAVCKARAKYYRDEAAEWERRGYTPEIHSRESAALNIAELLDVRTTDD